MIRTNQGNGFGGPLIRYVLKEPLN